MLGMCDPTTLIISGRVRYLIQEGLTGGGSSGNLELRLRYFYLIYASFKKWKRYNLRRFGHAYSPHDVVLGSRKTWMAADRRIKRTCGEKFGIFLKPFLNLFK